MVTQQVDDAVCFALVALPAATTVEPHQRRQLGRDTI